MKYTTWQKKRDISLEYKGTYNSRLKVIPSVAAAILMEGCKQQFEISIHK